jgi:HlyD family secretion protein
VRAESSITQAEAQISRIDAALADRVLRAPFAGTITEINIAAGETVGSEPIMTLLSSGDFEIKARIPEIDIGRLSIGQRVEMLFDAKSDTTVRGVITFISLKSTEIEGVSYYEAYIKPDTAESWIRSGLNADIDIILKEETQSLRIPKRFVQYEGSTPSVQKQIGETISSVPVTVLLEGTDGYVAITGLNAGDVVVAP